MLIAQPYPCSLVLFVSFWQYSVSGEGQNNQGVTGHLFPWEGPDVWSHELKRVVADKAVFTLICVSLKALQDCLILCMWVGCLYKLFNL